MQLKSRLANHAEGSRAHKLTTSKAFRSFTQWPLMARRRVTDAISTHRISSDSWGPRSIRRMSPSATRMNDTDSIHGRHSSSLKSIDSLGKVVRFMRKIQF